MIRRFVLSLLLALGGLVSAQRPAFAQAGVLAEGTLRVVHEPRQRLLARDVMDAARRPFPLPGFPPAAAPESTTIVLAATPEAWTEATGGRAPEWSGGVAFPQARVIVLPTYPQPGVAQREAAVVLRHELAHLMLRERLPGRIPRWFDEGYAELASGGWDVESAWGLRVAFLLGKVPPLDSLTLGWPADGGQARLAYLLSATAVDHLRRKHGPEGFALLMEGWRREGSLDQAMRTTFGMTLGQFEDEWRRDVRTRYGWLLAAGSVALVWFIATVLALLAWIPRRRRMRAQLETLRAEDRMLPPPRPDWETVEYPIAEPPPAPER